VTEEEMNQATDIMGASALITRKDIDLEEAVKMWCTAAYER
jgi:hypothetical protein